MAASREDIRNWFRRGARAGHAYMLVICDQFEWEDYPVFVDTAEEASKKKRAPGAIQKAMEIYDLRAAEDAQLAMHRCWAL